MIYKEPQVLQCSGRSKKELTDFLKFLLQEVGSVPEPDNYYLKKGEITDITRSFAGDLENVNGIMEIVGDGDQRVGIKCSLEFYLWSGPKFYVNNGSAYPFSQEYLDGEMRKLHTEIRELKKGEK